MSTLEVGNGTSLTVKVFRSSATDRITKATSGTELKRAMATMSVNLACIRATSKRETSVAKAHLATPMAAPIKANGAKECSQATASSPGPMETDTKANIPKV